MKLLITGGAGFIGSNFVHHIRREHPEYALVIVDKLTYAGNLRNLSGALDSTNFEFVRMDICDPAVRDVMHGCNAIVHFAAESHVDRSIEDAAAFVRTNVEGTWNLIEAARHTHIVRFVHVSTDEVYGSLGETEQCPGAQVRRRSPTEYGSDVTPHSLTCVWISCSSSTTSCSASRSLISNRRFWGWNERSRVSGKATIAAG